MTVGKYVLGNNLRYINFSTCIWLHLKSLTIPHTKSIALTWGTINTVTMDIKREFSSVTQCERSANCKVGNQVLRVFFLCKKTKSTQVIKLSHFLVFSDQNLKKNMTLLNKSKTQGFHLTWEWWDFQTTPILAPGF